MKTSPPDRIAGLSLRALCVLALATAACCVVSVQKTMQSAESFIGGGSALPKGLSEINTECWDAASQALPEARKMGADDGVDSLWDFMTRLRASSQPQHKELFMKLAQAFWKRYVNCVLSRAHGLGKRRSGISVADRQVLF